MKRASRRWSCVAVGAVVALASAAPELRRYLKIRSM